MLGTSAMGLKDKASQVLRALGRGDTRQAATALSEALDSARVRLLDEVVSRVSGHPVHTDGTSDPQEELRSAPPVAPHPAAPVPQPSDAEASTGEPTPATPAPVAPHRAGPVPRPGDASTAEPAPSTRPPVAAPPAQPADASTAEPAPSTRPRVAAPPAHPADASTAESAPSTRPARAPAASPKEPRPKTPPAPKAAASEPSVSSAAPAPLPTTYEAERLVLLVRDPTWAFAYWDFSAARLQEASQGLVDPRALLRFYELGSDEPLIDADVDPENGNYYLRVPRPGRDYEARLVLVGAGGEVREVARSNSAQPPTSGPSAAAAKPRFVRMDAQTEVLERADQIEVPAPRLVLDAAASAAPPPYGPRTARWASVLAKVRHRRVMQDVSGTGAPLGTSAILEPHGAPSASGE